MAWLHKLEPFLVGWSGCVHVERWHTFCHKPSQYSTLALRVLLEEVCYKARHWSAQFLVDVEWAQSQR